MEAFVNTFKRKPHYLLVIVRLQAMEGVDPARGIPTSPLKAKNRKPILNMALAMQQRTSMQGLWDGATTIELTAKFVPLYSA